MLTLENYSSHAGLKYSKPIIHELFYPVPADKYIIIETSEKKDGEISKTTIWAQIIVDIDKILSTHKSDIKIVFLNTNGQGIDETLNVIGLNKKNISFKHLAYIIKNSLLYCGENDDSIMLSSIFAKKIVQINSPIQTSKPFWSEPEDYSILSMEKANRQIPPEKITEAILQKLNLFKDTPSIKRNKTIYIGNNYIGPIILESTPDMICNNVAPNLPLYIRYDFAKSFSAQDIHNTISNLQGRKCAIFTNKSIPVENFFQLKENIISIVYDVTDSLDLEFLSRASMVSGNIKLIYIKKNSNEDSIIEKRKLDLVDTSYILDVLDLSEKKVENINFKSDIVYKSKKILLSKNKIFYSKAAMLSEAPVKSASENTYQKISEIKTKYQTDFLKEELDFCYLLLT
jgi:hypothetical protein